MSRLRRKVRWHFARRRWKRNAHLAVLARQIVTYERFGAHPFTKWELDVALADPFYW